MFNKKCIVASPIKGKIIPIEEVPDEVFSEKMLGDGFAVIPTDSLVKSPVTGTVTLVYKTCHAISFETKEGLEILIHIGLETVGLNGAPFHALVQEGDKVKTGDPLLEVDLKMIEESGRSIITPLIITNIENVKALKKDFNSPDKVLVAIMK